MKIIKKIIFEEIEQVIDLIYITTVQNDTSEIIKNNKKLFSSMFKESYNDMELFGYYIDNKIVGVIGIEDSNYIPILYVKKEYQNLHIGTYLLEYVKNYLQDKTALLEVCSVKKAIRFYEQNGFFKYNDCYQDKVMMFFNYSKKKSDL